MRKEFPERMKLYNQGYCDPEIAKKVGVSTPAISRWRKTRKLPRVFENRKRLTDWEIEKVHNFLARREHFRKKSYTERSFKRYKKGLFLFIMRLKKPLSALNHEDVENYILHFNNIDLSRPNELLRTNFVKKLKIPHISITMLYGFANSIIATHVFARDNAQCTVCKQMGKLHLHHMRGKYDLRLENLTTLCPRCHLTIRHAALRYPKQQFDDFDFY